MLSDWYGYQRLPHSEITNQALKQIDEFPWPVPNYVPVIYNQVFGPQRCKTVAGFPNPPPGVGYPCPNQVGSGNGGGGGSGGGGTVGPGDDSTGKLTPSGPVAYLGMRKLNSYILGTVFYSNDPTYLPSDWSGFSTATRTANNSTLSMSTTSVIFNSSTSSGSSASSLTASKTSSTSKTSTKSSSSTSAVSSSAPSSGAAWTLSLFEKPGCQGDHYNFTALSQGTASYCINKPSELSTDWGNVSCTYGSAGHAPSAHCAGGPWPIKPKSWALKNVFCSSFLDTQCKMPNKKGFHIDSGQGCSNAPVDLSFIESLSCSPHTPSCRTCIKCYTDCWDSVAQDIEK